MTIEKQIEADAAVLLYRALFEKEIHVFGEDGFGKFGRNDLPKTFKIVDISVDIELNEYTGDASGIAYLTLDGYDAADCGMIMTDLNADISLRVLLQKEHIDPACIKWANLSDQGQHSIALFLDVPLLLDWA